MPLVHTEEFKKRQAELNTTHGLSKTHIYKIYHNMKQRCYNQNNTEYLNYGGRGIKICREWLDDFTAFYKWMLVSGWNNEKETREQTIERNDVNGDYCPENCRLIPLKEQSLNKTNSRKITAFGETKTLSQWSNETGISFTTIKARIDRLGWSSEKAVSEPTREMKIATKEKITFDGKTMTLKQWSDELSMPLSTLSSRTNYLGWDIEKALSTPVKSNGKANENNCL